VAFIDILPACYDDMPILARFACTLGVSPVTLLFLRLAFATLAMMALLAFGASRYCAGARVLRLVVHFINTVT
jgi:hypothetical protein